MALALLGHPCAAATAPYAPGVQQLPDGRLRLQSWLYPGARLDVEARELRLVNPGRKVSTRGLRVGMLALAAGRRGYPNRKFLRRSPRLACAAFVSWTLRQAGVRRGSNSTSALYSLLRKQGGVLIASKVSTRYTPWFPYYRSGDILFFYKGSRFAHVEIYVGGGNTVGTSSSAMRIGVRRVGNRGFSRMSVMRL